MIHSFKKSDQKIRDFTIIFHLLKLNKKVNLLAKPVYNKLGELPILQDAIDIHVVLHSTISLMF